MENLRHICIFLCMILTFTLNGCSIKKEPISKSSFFMGTIVNITLYDKFDEGIIDKAFNKISEIESLLSLNIQNSEINKRKVWYRTSKGYQNHLWHNRKITRIL